MLIINYCEKHNPSGPQGGLSKYIVEYIKNDIILKKEDLIWVNFHEKGKVFCNLLFDKKSFEKYKLKKDFDLDTDFENKDDEKLFFEKHGGDICYICVKEYEEKHNLDLTSKWISPSPFTSKE